MDDLISVIIPTYKRPERLLRALKSVLSQSYKNFEVLIINDDDDELYLKELLLKANDDRIRLFKNERSKGANGARNTGVIHSRGNYLAFLDDDDEWLDNALETQVGCLKNTKNDTGIVYGAFLLEKGNKWHKVIKNKEGNLFEELIIGEFEVGASSNIFLKKSVIERVGLWDEELYRQEDLEFLIRVLRKYRIIFNNNIIVKIYGHNTPNSRKAFTEREKYLKKILIHLDEINEQKQNKFFSDHYRRQVYYLVKLKDYKMAKEYWKKAFFYKKVSLRKDVKILLNLISKNE